MNITSSDQGQQPTSTPDEIKEAIRKKPDSGVPTVLFIGFIGLLGAIFSFVGGICYFHSMGIQPVVDCLADYGGFIGLAITALVFIMLAVSFVFYLVQLKWKAVICSLVLCLIPLFSLAFIMPTMGRLSPRGFCEKCGEQLHEIGLFLDTYGKQHDGRYPGLDWCDFLIKDGKIKPKQLFCRGVFPNLLEGFCSYALNDQVIGKERSQLPADTVVLFETDSEVKDPQYSMTEIRRKVLPDNSVERYFQGGRVKVGQWNQVGGIDIITCSHHAGLGCNVLFVDGHVEFVRKKDIPNLRWKPEDN